MQDTLHPLPPCPKSVEDYSSGNFQLVLAITGADDGVPEAVYGLPDTYFTIKEKYTLTILHFT